LDQNDGQAADTASGHSRHARHDASHPVEGSWRETRQEGEEPMKESTLAKITASVAAAKGMAQKALAADPNPQWTEYEIQSIDEWILSHGLKIDRSEAIRRLVALGLKAKGK
jgi:hypothetical protein